jgi:hypothetical protein
MAFIQKTSNFIRKHRKDRILAHLACIAMQYHFPSQSNRPLSVVGLRRKRGPVTLTWTAWVQFLPSPTHETCLCCSVMSGSMKLACLSISKQDNPGCDFHLQPECVMKRLTLTQLQMLILMPASAKSLLDTIGSETGIFGYQRSALRGTRLPAVIDDPPVVNFVSIVKIRGKYHFFFWKLAIFWNFWHFLKLFETFWNFLKLFEKSISKNFWNSQSQLCDFGARLRITFYASKNYF